MTDEDRLTRLVADALAPSPVEPPPARVVALRVQVAERRAAQQSYRSAGLIDRRGRRPRPLAAALIAAAVIAAFLAGGTIVSDDRSATRQATPLGVVEFQSLLRPPTGRGASATAIGRRAGTGRIVELRSRDLPILPTGDLYEVWFVGPGDGPGDRNRISAGTFHPDEAGRTAVVLTAAVDPAKYPVLSVTAEPCDGDPEPTGPEVLRSDIEVVTGSS